MAFAPIKLSKPAEKFVYWLADYPWLAILAGLLAIGGLIPGLGKLQTDFTYRAFFLPDDPQLIDYDKFERRFGNDDSAVIGIHSPSGIFDAESIRLIQNFTEAMWQVTDVIRVDSLANYNWVHANGDELVVEKFFDTNLELTPELLAERQRIALSHEVMPNYLISKDAKTTMVFATLKPGFEKAPDDKLIADEIDKVIAKFQSGDHVFYQSGNPTMGRAFLDAAVHDMSTLIPIVIGLVFAMVYVMLRSFTAVLMSLVVVILSVIATMGAAGQLGIKLTNVTTMLPQILIAVGIADAVHILAGFLLALRSGQDRRGAALYSLTKNFQPTIMTTVTTTGGFLSFTTATLQPMKDIGVMGGLGAFVAWFVTYFILGGALFLLPLKSKPQSAENTAARQRRAARITDWIDGNRVAIVATFIALAAACTYVSTKIEVNADPFKYFAEGYPIRVANDFLEANIGGARGIEVVIETGREEGAKDPAVLKKVEALQAWIDQIPGVTRSLSIIDILKSTNRSLNGDAPEEYRLVDDPETIAQEIFLYTMSLPQGMDLNDRITLKNDALRLTVLWTITDSDTAVKTAQAIEAKAKALGLDAHYTGKTMLWQGMNGKVVFSFLSSLALALTLISVMMVVYFRSFKIGLISMIPNCIPLAFGGAILWLTGKSLDVGTIMVYSVCLGIAVDDTIHIFANFYRLTKQESKTAHQAIAEIIDHTGMSLIATTSILVVGFGTFLLATFQPNMYFGLLTAGILSIALITDLTFAPASLLLGQSKRI